MSVRERCREGASMNAWPRAGQYCVARRGILTRLLHMCVRKAFDPLYHEGFLLPTEHPSRQTKDLNEHFTGRTPVAVTHLERWYATSIITDGSST